MHPREAAREDRPAGALLGRVAVPGAARSWSDLALDRLAAAAGGAAPVRLHLDSFAAAVAAVVEGRADHALLPVENTVAGPLVEVLRLIAARPLVVVKEMALPVRHCLAGLPGTTPADVRRVLSHPVALRQCGRFLATLAGAVPEPCADTARAAEIVAGGGDRRLAAICSRACARRLGLAVLCADVADARNNTTRFVLVARRAPDAGRGSDAVA